MKTTRALLVNPPGGQTKPQYRQDVPFFPYSLIYLMNRALEAGYPVTLCDLFIDPRDRLVEMVNREQPAVVGITTQIANRFLSLDLARDLRALCPESLIVLGGKSLVDGPGVAKEIIEREPQVDVVVTGEGEITFERLLDAIDNRTDLDHVAGIVFRADDGRAVETPRRADATDLDALTIDYSILPRDVTSRYSNMVTLRNHEALKGYSMMLGRGCEGRCVFCSYGHRGLGFRNLEGCLAEIEAAVEQGVTHFSFDDPSFCNSAELVTDLCNALLDRRLAIEWSCESRVDLPLALLRLMREAGCIAIDFGVESGSERVLKAIGKRISIDQVLTFSSACKDLGIRAGSFFLVSLPGETDDDVELTLDLMQRLRQEYGVLTRLGLTRIHPATALERLARQRGLLPEGFSWLDRTYRHGLAFIDDPDVPPFIDELSPETIERALRTNARSARNALTLAQIITLLKRDARQVATDPVRFIRYGVDYLRARLSGGTPR